MTLFKGILFFVFAWFFFTFSSAVSGQEITVGFSGPLSGPAAEYGQDCVNGVEMAVKDINAAGGITAKGKKHLVKLVKLDDRNDPTAAVANARRMRELNKVVAIFNPVFTTIAAIMKINQEKDKEFLVMAFTSTPKVSQMGNKLAIAITAPFTLAVQAEGDLAWKQGWRKLAMLVTLGAYGDEWRQAFKAYWEKLGGTVTADKPANYYKDTDFSSQLSAVMATKPDAMLIGGPNAGTALVIEQARGKGFKGGFILLDQAKMDYIANIIKGYKMLENTIGSATVAGVPFSTSPGFIKRYEATYKRLITWEALRTYSGMYFLAKAIAAADSADDVMAIRDAFSKVPPVLGDTIPTETFGITEKGRLKMTNSIQMVKNGKLTKAVSYYWWPKTQQEWNNTKKLSKSPVRLEWFKAKIANVE